jgi:glyoxylase-like metal-dependent hydrolase (beta-lactamase superfamily II)
LRISVARSAPTPVTDVIRRSYEPRHIDHTGDVAELRRRSGARVMAHALDAPAVAGETVVPERSLVPRLAVRIHGEGRTGAGRRRADR